MVPVEGTGNCATKSCLARRSWMRVQSSSSAGPSAYSTKSAFKNRLRALYQPRGYDLRMPHPATYTHRSLPSPESPTPTVSTAPTHHDRPHIPRAGQQPFVAICQRRGRHRPLSESDATCGATSANCRAIGPDSVGSKQRNTASETVRAPYFSLLSKRR